MGFLQIRSSVEKERTTINTMILSNSFFSIQTQHQTHIKPMGHCLVKLATNHSLERAGVFLCVGVSNRCSKSFVFALINFLTRHNALSAVRAHDI